VIVGFWQEATAADDEKHQCPDIGSLCDCARKLIPPLHSCTRPRQKRMTARSHGVVGRQFASVEKFWAWRTLEIWIEQVFKYHHAVQPLHFYDPLKELFQKD